MYQVIQKSIVFNTLLILTLTSCSGVSKRTAAGKSLGEETYTDGNRAPASMTPPESADVLDPVYLRSQADYHFTLAEAYGLEGNTARAIEEYKLVLVFDPQASRVHLKLAGEYLKKGMVSESILEAQSAVDSMPESTDARLLLAGLYSSIKAYPKATEQYHAILKTNPSHIESYLYIGALLAEQEKYAEAIETFDKVAKMPNNTSVHLAHYYSGRVWEEQGNPQKAQESFEKSLRIKPEFVDAVLHLSTVFGQTKQKEKAVKLMASYQDKFGPNERVAERLANHYLETEDYERAYRQYEILAGADPENLNARVKMALILIEKKDFVSAVGRLKEIIVKAPESDKIRYYLAAVYEEMKDYDQAIEQFTTIPATSPFYEESVIHAAYLHKVSGQVPKAIQLVEDAVSKRQDLQQLHALYASLLDETKEYQKAVAMLEKAIGRFPKNEQLLFFLGSLQDKVGNRPGTIANMKKVLALNGDHIQALNYLAYTYAEMGENLTEAENMAKRAIDLKGDDAYIRDTLGWVLFKMGRYQDAVRELERAHNMKSAESIIAEHLGDAYYRFQLPQKAKAMYVKAVQLESDEKTAEKIRTKIREIDTSSYERRPASLEQPVQEKRAEK